MCTNFILIFYDFINKGPEHAPAKHGHYGIDPSKCHSAGKIKLLTNVYSVCRNVLLVANRTQSNLTGLVRSTLAS